MIKKISFAILCCLTVFGSTPSRAALMPPKVIEPEAEENFDVRGTLGLPEAKATMLPASLLLGYQDGKSYLSLAFSNQTLVLNRVAANGRATALATVKKSYALAKGSTPFVAQWRDGSLRVIFNGQTILRKDNLGDLDGAVALSSEKTVLKINELEVQPVEPVEFADDFMRSDTVPGLWETVIGTWKLNTAGDPKLGANPFSYIAQGKPAMSVAGRWFWSDYAASVSVRSSGDGAIGLIAYWQDDKNYLLCKWYAANAAGSPATKKQLWRVVGGVPTLIAAAPGGYHPQQWYRLAISAADGTVKMLVDGTTALEKKTDLFGQGKVGLFADSDAEAMFDDMQVQPADEVAVSNLDEVEAGPARFANDDSMQNWASPKGQWIPVEASPSTLWNRGMFFGDYTVDVKTTGIFSPGAKIQVLLAGDGTTPESGYALQVKANDDKSVESVLLRSGKPVSTPIVTALSDVTSCLIKLQRVGRKIQGFVGKANVVEFTDSKPLSGRRGGYDAVVAPVVLSDAHVSGGNVTDYTFFRAPTDWQVTSGNWDMASRWICTPGWSWYAGWSDRIAAVWNKRSLTGDFAIEVFAASKMDSPNPPYYLHPRDLNITVSGDGRDLASGYSFIFGGWNNTSTRILRGTQTVAQTDQVLLPSSAAYHSLAHHKWFSLRVEKNGDTISYYVDRKLALQFKDPSPLTGKKIALWTSGNGIMIARATIYDEKQGGVELLPAALTPDNNLPAAPTENLNWESRLADATVSISAIAPDKSGERPAVRAVNVGGGGNFAIKPQMEPIEVSKTPKLTFQCRINPGAEINLYVQVKGVTHVVRLNGPSLEDDAENVKFLGAVATPADGKWHDVNLDLAALLKPLYPGELQLWVEEIFLGNLTRDTYRQAGFGANYPGTSYLVRALALRSADGKVVKRVDPQLKAQAKTETKPPLSATLLKKP